MSLIGRVPIEILPGKCHITWVLAVLLLTIEFQMEPLAPNFICFHTKKLVEKLGVPFEILLRKATQPKPMKCDAFPAEFQSEPFRMNICFDLYTKNTSYYIVI